MERDFLWELKDLGMEMFKKGRSPDLADYRPILGAALAAERARAARIADKYAEQEREDTRVAGSPICFYAQIIADAIRGPEG